MITRKIRALNHRRWQPPTPQNLKKDTGEQKKMYEMESHASSGNINKFYIYFFLSRLNLWLPIYILYLLGRNFSMTQITLLDSMFWLVMVVFEVPTGAVADKWGKKHSLIFSCILTAGGLACFGLAKTYVLVLLAYFLWAVGVTFESGALSAFLYDSLKNIGKEAEYSKFVGRGMSIALIASSIGSVTAGVLGGISLALPIFVSSVIAIVMLCIALTFREPEIERKEKESYFTHVKESLGYSWKHPQLRTLLFFYAFTFSAIWIIGIFYQPYLKNLGIRVEIVGVIYLFATLLAAAGASLASRFESITGESGFLISIPVIFVFSYLFMGFLHSLVAISFIFAVSFFRGAFWPIMSKYLNKRIPSERRATIISLASLMYSVIMIPSEPVFGNLADRFSLNISIIILAVVYGIIASIIVGFWFARCRKSDS